ncbi:MAG: hypothetical protein K5990_06530 [Oscillospiraceae bacterium]|nr:hypothetical protein [Oscillospiraceae bacterium]
MKQAKKKPNGQTRVSFLHISFRMKRRIHHDSSTHRKGRGRKPGVSAGWESQLPGILCIIFCFAMEFLQVSGCDDTGGERKMSQRNRSF